jgi:hypothetical protein
MAMTYPHTEIADADVPRAAMPFAQHILDTYASETNKVAAIWHSFTDADLTFHPHERASTVGDILKHQVLSERRFFAEFLGAPEPPATELLPPALSIGEVTSRYVHLARARLPTLATAAESWWLGQVPFFDVRRERIWVFWRRVLHTAHHRTQLSVYLRLMNRQVPPTYGPTADVTWQGADPTRSVEAAARR